MEGGQYEDQDFGGTEVIGEDGQPVEGVVSIENPLRTLIKPLDESVRENCGFFLG